MNYKRVFLLGIMIIVLMGFTGCSGGKEDVASRDTFISHAPLIYAENPQEENMAGLLQESASSAMVQVCVGEVVGTGILWEANEENLVIITAAHVTETGAGLPEIVFADGARITVSQCKMAEADLTFLFVNTGDITDECRAGLRLPNLPVEESGELQKEDGIIVMGSAEGVAANAYEGVVSEPWVYVEDFGQHMIWVNAPIVPGMSGGGVFDYRGVLQGMICGAGEEDAAVALPISVVAAEYEMCR